jgi:hypothetical protein
MAGKNAAKKMEEKGTSSLTHFLYLDLCRRTISQTQNIIRMSTASFPPVGCRLIIRGGCR